MQRLEIWLLAIGVMFLILIVLFSNAQLWGHKQVAILDIWSSQHLLTGILLGMLLSTLSRRFPENQLLSRGTFLVLFLAYLWEGTEYLLETAAPGIVTHFMGGVEYFWNRFLADPLIVFGGAVLGRHLKGSRWQWILSLTVLILFVAIHLLLGKSTYFHEL